MFKILLIATIIYTPTCSGELSDELLLPDLPRDHLERYLNTFSHLKTVVGSLVNSSSDACWGHEAGCRTESRFQTPHCPGDHTGWVQSKAAQISTFYHQADFGYISDQIDELSPICLPRYVTDSSLECSEYLRFCRGRNLYFDFRDVAKRKALIRYDMDVLHPGQILGHCKLNYSRLHSSLEHMGALQSWAPELRNLDVSPKPIIPSDNNGSLCDQIIDTPTFIMKIDSTYNMYHHFCDFFNLYVSLFVNQTHPTAFSSDVQILIWETYTYDSPFAETFKAFSKNPVWTLNEVKGKRFCFKNVVLPLLPRMIFGLYYNTPLIHGCSKSGLFRAFSEFILHRLHIKNESPLRDGKVRITMLSRRTRYRQVLNEHELIERISRNKDYDVRKVSFERLNFTQQLDITANTDILVGMHGAGLTHLLFLPNWAAIFELYNCEDPNCYKDLARLRGIEYFTWQRSDLVYAQDQGTHPEVGAHAKFTNYRFDVDEFSRIVEQAAAHVRSQKEFQQSTLRSTKDEL